MLAVLVQAVQNQGRITGLNEALWWWLTSEILDLFRQGIVFASDVPSSTIILFDLCSQLMYIIAIRKIQFTPSISSCYKMSSRLAHTYFLAVERINFAPTRLRTDSLYLHIYGPVIPCA